MILVSGGRDESEPILSNSAKIGLLVANGGILSLFGQGQEGDA
jgi:hypothetical protein